MSSGSFGDHKESKPAVIRHAFFSAEAAELYGYVVWRSVDGVDYKTTAVYMSEKEGRKNYMWSDATYQGPVNKLVKLCKIYRDCDMAGGVDW